jgi:hypothetical protein
LCVPQILFFGIAKLVTNWKLSAATLKAALFPDNAYTYHVRVVPIKIHDGT